MRIGLFHARLPLTGTKPSGADVYVARLGAALAAAGHDVELWAFGPADAVPGTRRRPLRPSAWGQRKVARQYVAPFALNVRDTASLDVLHLFGDDTFYFRRQVPTVRTFLGSALFESLTATSRRRRLNQAITFGMELLAASLADARYGIGPDSELVYRADGTLHVGIELPPQPAPGARPTILFVGTWSGRKRGHLVHRAFTEHVRPALPEAELIMVSDRCEPAAGVRWVRAPSDDELGRLFHAARTFCLPSAYEGFGLPYLEALAHGVDVVATPNFGALALLHGTRCAVVEPSALGPALMASLTRAPERMAADAKLLRERAAEYSWKRAVAAHERAYALAIERFTARSRR